MCFLYDYETNLVDEVASPPLEKKEESVDGVDAAVATSSEEVQPRRVVRQPPGDTRIESGDCERLGAMTVGQPQICQGVLEVPADGLCLYHCYVAAINVESWLQLSAEAQVSKARKVREALACLVSNDCPDNARRLQFGEGAEAYPGIDDLPHFVNLLHKQYGVLTRIVWRCQQEPSMGHVYTPSESNAPVSFVIEYCDSIDGAGHRSSHFNLVQSWLAEEVLPRGVAAQPPTALAFNKGKEQTQIPFVEEGAQSPPVGENGNSEKNEDQPPARESSPPAAVAPKKRKVGRPCAPAGFGRLPTGGFV